MHPVYFLKKSYPIENLPVPTFVVSLYWGKKFKKKRRHCDMVKSGYEGTWSSNPQNPYNGFVNPYYDHGLMTIPYYMQQW